MTKAGGIPTFVSKVPRRGLEPPRLAAHPPQGCSATITTPGLYLSIFAGNSGNDFPTIRNAVIIFNFFSQDELRAGSRTSAQAL